jgi:hypothetical protein
MAQPDIIRGTYFSLLMGDGAGPEVFTALCGISTKSFTAAVNTNDQFTRDCDTPEDVPIRRVIATGKQWDLTGEGVLNRSNLEMILDAQAVVKNYRFLFTEPADDEVYQGYWAGPAMLTNLQVTAEDENFANISINLVSDGEWIWTPVTPP